MGILHPRQTTEAQGLVEYALIIVLLALAMFAVMSNLGGGVFAIYTYIQETLPF